uniref:60S ribosomal protein L5 n=1 Tax=Pleurostomum flabellatum TaxID=405751 RepID=A0A7T0M419_9EUKA|nr:60S ribosomal protein L5 [Pleurostomum flabellatum]QPL15615.1 60S ribosomal protein L5 [Pleurostomum flabellatum]
MVEKKIQLMIGDSIRIRNFSKNYLFSFMNEKSVIFYSCSKKNLNLLYGLTFNFLYLNVKSNKTFFFLHLMLLGKFLSNSVNFIFNTRIHKKFKIKVGGRIFLSNHKIYNFIYEIFFLSLPKFIFSLKRFHHISGEKIHYLMTDRFQNFFRKIFFQLKKFLFFNFFVYNGEYDKYYDQFDFLMHRMKVIFFSRYKSFLINKQLFRLNGLNVV